MFKKRIHLDGIKKPAQNVVPWASWQLEPHLREQSFDHDEFSEHTNNKLNSLNRNFLAYTIANNLLIPGIEDGKYDVNFDLFQYSNESSKNKGKPIGRKTKKSTIYVHTTDPFMETIVTSNTGRPLDKLLAKIKQDESGKMSISSSLLSRARELDNEYCFNKGYVDYNDLIIKYLDPKEIESLSHLQNQFGLIDANGYQVNRYFNHMAQLTLNGNFADNINSKYLSGIKGLRNNEEHSIINTSKSPAVDYKEMGCNLPLKEELKILKKLLLNPWYKNEQLTKPISIDNMLMAFDNLGRASRAVYEHGTQTSVSSIATEGFVSELYTSFTGKKNGKNLQFVNKLGSIMDITETKEYIQPFIDIFTSKDYISTSNVRGGVIHTGNIDQKDRHSQLDTWAKLFYEDLTKTLITVVAGKPEAYFDFDAYCRGTNICYGSEPCATVPVDIAKHYEKKKIIFNGKEI
jgi:hypothetical protein